MSRLSSFFLFCSGCDESILQKTPTEHNKYVGIGATVFFTGLFATVAAGYALYTVFGNLFSASIFAIMWGLLIFNLDRYIVSSMKKERQFYCRLVHRIASYCTCGYYKHGNIEAA